MKISSDTIELFENGNSDEIIKLLNESPDIINLKTEDGWNIGQLSAYYNIFEVFKTWLDKADAQEIKSSYSPLLISIEENNLDFLKKALELEKINKLDLNVREKSGENLLHLAITRGDFDLAKKLYTLGLSCFQKNSQGESAFSEIIKQGNTELFDYFNEYTNLKDNYEELFIKKAIQYDRSEILERLFPISTTNVDDLFNLACGFSSVKCANVIMQSGEIIPGRKQVMDLISLITQKYEDKEEVFAATNITEYLFAIKIPFNQFVNDRGQSAWMLCIQNNNEDVFEKLMSSTENVNVSDNEEHSPLFYAIEKNNLNMVKILLKKKANANHKDRVNNTPVIKAVEIGNTQIVKELLKYSHCVNELNNNNEHALSIAIKKRRMDIVTDLIWAGGEITTNPVKFIEEKQMFHFGSDGNTDRFSYHEEEQIDNFVSLSKLGFKLDQVNEDGDSFLIHFIKNGYISNFSAIMRCQINPNQIDSEGNSALMCACNKRQDEYFNSLIRKFGNIDYLQKNESGDTVFDICFKHSRADRLTKLLQIAPEIPKEKINLYVKLVAKDGNLEDIKGVIEKYSIDLNEIDENGNDLLMYALAGGNIKNFKFLTEKCENKLDLKRENKYGHSIKAMVEAIQNIEIKQELSSLISRHTKKP